MGHTVRNGILIALTVLCLAAQVTSLPLPDFFPFGPNFGDQTLPTGNDESVTVALQQAFPFYGESRESITVHTDGFLNLIHVGPQSSSASIYVFFADVDTSSLGQVFYRESTDPVLLDSAQTIVESLLPAFSATPPTSLFIATWFYVGYFDNNDDRANTFQCVLGTDGNISFAFLLYADEMIEWTTGDADGGNGGLGGDPADVGFVDDSDGSNSFFIPGSNTSDIRNVDTTTNVGLPGGWLFRVDGESISNPILDECDLDIDNCDQNAACVDLSDGFLCVCRPGFTGDGFVCLEDDVENGLNVSGSGSASGSASGSGSGLPMDGSCVDAGFTTCCDANVSDSCEISVSADNSSCFCNQECFLFHDCCFDIQAVPCLPDIFVGFAEQEYTVEEDAIFVTLSITAESFIPYVPREIHVLLYTNDGTAEATRDYEGTIRILVFSENGQQNVTVEIFDDDIVENPEEFTAHLTTTQDFVIINPGYATVTIEDDSDTVEVFVQEASYTVNETATSLSVCVEINGTLERNVTVSIETVDGDAIATADYMAIDQPLVFDTAPAQMCVVINIRQDTVVENDETFTVSLSSSDPAVVITTNTAEVTIVDETVVNIGFEAAFYAVSEYQGCLEVCLIATGANLTRSVEVTLSTQNGSAIEPEDYIQFVDTLVFSGTETQVCTNITIINDLIVEPDQDFLLQLNSTDRAVEFLSQSAVVLILDNDEVTIRLEQELYTVAEDEGPLIVCAQIINGSLARSVNFTLRAFEGPGTAMDGLDFTGITVDWTFDTNNENDLLCENVEILNDTLVEDTETFYAILETTDPAVVFAGQPPGAPRTGFSRIFITDDDEVTIRLEQELYTVAENEGPLTVCAQIIDGTLNRSVNFTLRAFEGPGTAMDGLDFTGITVDWTFDTNNENDLLCEDVEILNDTLVEDTETFYVILETTDPAVVFAGQPPGAPSTGFSRIFITDDDKVTIRLEQELYTVAENEGPLTVCAQIIDGTLNRSVNFTLRAFEGPGTAMDGLDFTGITVDWTFDTNNENDLLCEDVEILNDTLVEDTETFYAILETTDPAVVFAGQPPGAPRTGFSRIFITDDDEVTIRLEQELYTVAEDEGPLTVCAQIIDGTLNRSVNFTLRAFEGPGTAMDGLDFTGITVDWTFDTNNENDLLCEDVEILNDTLVEDTETFYAILETTDPAVVFAGQPPGAPRTGFSRIFITDDDEVTIRLEQELYTVAEDEGPLTVCAQIIDGSLNRSVNFTLRAFEGPGTAMDGMDFTGISVDLTFDMNNANDLLCENVEILNDTLVEDTETFYVILETTDPAVVFAGQPSGAPRTGFSRIFITDDDEVTIRLEQELYTVAENEGPLAVCAQIIKGSLNRSVNFTLSAFQGPGTAIDGLDFTGITVDWTFDTNNANDLLCEDVEILNDILVEDTETFYAILETTDPAVVFAGQPPGAPRTGFSRIFITDNDNVTIRLEQELYTVAEDEGPLTVCAQNIDGALNRSVNFTLRAFEGPGTAMDGMDFTGISVDLTFDMNNANNLLCENVEILNDTLVEDTETFYVILETTDPAVVFAGQPPGAPRTGFSRVFITDDDGPPTLSLQQANYSVVEDVDTSVLVCAILSGSSLQVPVTAMIITSDITATADVDYGSINQNLTFPVMSGVSIMCVNISIIDDDVGEGEESFLVRLMTTDLNVTLATAEVFIMDEDGEVMATFEESELIINENIGQRPIICIDLISQSIQRDIVLKFSTVNGTATGDMDFISERSIVVYTPLIATADAAIICERITIVDDLVIEPVESFTLSLSSDDSAITFDIDTLTVTIIDDDAVNAVIGFEQASYTVTETDDSSQNLEVCVFANGNLDDAVTVTLRTMQDTATGGLDFSETTRQLTFQTGRSNPQCVFIGILGDVETEGTESFIIRLTASDSAVMLSPANATVVIMDNIEPSVDIGFAESSYSVSETNSNFFTDICVVASSFVGNPSRTFTVTVETIPGTANAGTDFIRTARQLTFSSGGMNPQCVPIEIVGDVLIENDESFTVTLTTEDPLVTVTSADASVTILNDDVLPPSDDPITLINETPRVDRVGTVASVRVEFTLRSDVRNVICDLRDVFDVPDNPQDCLSGFFDFTGLPAFRRMSYQLAIIARNELGEILETILRPVRLGFNGDCAVNFINAVDQALVFNNGLVFIEWTEVGPVASTECRLDGGRFRRCTSPYQANGLSAGSHSLKVRPNGAGCRRRIRRTINFIVM